MIYKIQIPFINSYNLYANIQNYLKAKGGFFSTAHITTSRMLFTSFSTI
jgi:hypothetical protein